MKKKALNKRSVILCLCVCMILCLCACGGADSSAQTASSENTTEAAVTREQEDADPEITAEPEETEPAEAAGTGSEEEVSDTENTADEAEPAESETETVLPEEPEETYSNTLVVFFSHTGTTRGVSEYLHSLVGGDLVEIVPVNPYPEGYNDALDPAKQEQRDNARPEIAGVIEHFDSYEVIYLGYPIWWGTTPMIINTFLESYDFTGKTVVPYATSGGTGIGQSIEDIRNEIPAAEVKDGLLVRENEEIIPWLQGLGLYE